MFQVPQEAFRNDTVYHQFGTDCSSNILGCGFLNKKGRDCTERDNVYRHYGVVLVLSGTAAQIDNEGNRSDISPGCLLQRIPGKRQTLLIKDDGSWLEFFICISRSMYGVLLSMDLLDKKQHVLFSGLSRALYNECNNFLSVMKNTHPVKVNMLVPEALKLILTLHELHKENSASSEDREIIRKACLILSKPASYQRPIRELAGDMGIGYEKFRKLFKNQVGTSPKNYIMQKRMDLAKEYLISRRKSIKAIALELGFSDAYAFSKQFRNIVGLSPSDFRHNY